MVRRMLVVFVLLGLSATQLVQAADAPVKKVRRDLTKVLRIEAPVERLIAAGTARTVSAATRSKPAPVKFQNPKVEPGTVRWHNDFEAACAASRKSGKPVLLFQLMGRLDDRFC